jgi:hypothetical protein
LLENKYIALGAAAVFLVVLWLSNGSMAAAFGALALIAGTGWVLKRFFGR